MAGLLSGAIQNAVLKDNAIATKKAIEKGGSSLAVHQIFEVMVAAMGSRSFLRGPLSSFCSVLKVYTIPCLLASQLGRPILPHLHFPVSIKRRSSNAMLCVSVCPKFLETSDTDASDSEDSFDTLL